MVVIPEIFGVNSHIQQVTDGFAADGYLAVAPAMFDRAQRNYDTGYSQPEIQAGVAIMQKLDPKQSMLDVQAAIAEAAKGGKVGIVGYCYGARFLRRRRGQRPRLRGALLRRRHAASSRRSPKCRCVYFGETASRPRSRKPRKSPPRIRISRRHCYAGAGHGFNCDQRAPGTPRPPSSRAAHHQFFRSTRLRGDVANRQYPARGAPLWLPTQRMDIATESVADPPPAGVERSFSFVAPAMASYDRGGSYIRHLLREVMRSGGRASSSAR